ncbi:lytic transglycosylase domain-containing protein [Klebsiella aerogenes]|uniref:lytic transglycosylase domain-containing protein n=1 Tax=Klebsiella aerogenes TaxID=548 RepID=UPI0038782D2C
MFDNPEDATAYAESLHNQQADEYLPKQNESQQTQQGQQPAKVNDGSLASGFTQLATQQKEGLDRSAEQGASLGAAMREAVTGESRMTPELAKLQNVGSAPELNAFSTDALRAGVAQLFGSDASQEQVLQSMGATLSQDEKGNTIVNLPSGSYALNKPGLSPQDVTSFLANALAFTPASRAGSVLGAAAKSGATDLALQGATQAVGGEDINPLQVAASAALGGAVKGVERGAGAVSRAASGQVSPEARASIKFADENSVPLHTTDLLQPVSRTGRAAQATAEAIPWIGTSGIRSTQQEARSKLVSDFAAKFGEYDPSIVVGSLKAKSAGIKKAAGNRLEQVQNAMTGVNIQPTRALQQIDDEIVGLQKLGKVADTDTISKLRAYRDELAGGNVDLQQLSNLRSQFRQDVKGERLVMPNRSDAAIQRVYRAMTGDIDSSIGQNLGNDTLRRYKQANAVYADEASKLQNTRLKNVLMKGDLTPEVVNNMLFSKNKSEVQNLYNSVGSIGRNQMRNGIIGKAMEKSDGSPDQFLRQLNIMSNQTGIAFKGQDAAYIKGLKNYLEETKRAGQAGVVTPTGQATIPFILGGASVANPKMLAVMGGYAGLARLYESKIARNALLKMASTPRGSTDFEKAAAKVSEVINSTLQAENR